MNRLLMLLCLVATQAAADQYVNGYFRSNGTYVAPHVRSNADSQRWNNYSTQGNTNPYTGQRGNEPLIQPMPQMPQMPQMPTIDSQPHYRSQPYRGGY